MKVLVTGANGFLGKTLVVRLEEVGGFTLDSFLRTDDVSILQGKVAAADAVIHLAGENRPADPSAFMEVNAGLTQLLCDFIRATGRPIPIIFASSTQAKLDNPYGASKRAGEEVLLALSNEPGQSCTIFRLPNVFGKWSRPNYNSAVATFCHNIARDLPIRIDDPDAPLTLAYVDDVVDAIIASLRSTEAGLHWPEVEPQFNTTVGAVAETLRAFRASRETLVTERVGEGLPRALYATYVSFLEPAQFSYEIPTYGDQRGVFVEMLKTPDSGQFSFFTAHPGITRGGHYHHSKTEKFLVIRGRASFRFRHLLTDETYSIETSGACSTIVETIPGWSHDITNIGDDELIVMLWANEIFDRNRPDTIARSV
ncbi:NAD-dependent epimerase/dehydratase family protein [Altererythrobacter arenosus]|uniref:NAD-dependent epimerase/dehydratase family protein n=1 Tax=Altererythrobacter arenosus TaxID=3032592 RepID=A0ABY8FXK1_9SPHN|nr:NAD-dependent epimerase/dehydratase family protein [Altererythrobacter sp. CAU 1644]WFL78723.1 NAD-dependent epimerase/dehydratase family protein [Altererythrobacter sp. CAU 1644]